MDRAVAKKDDEAYKDIDYDVEEDGILSEEGMCSNCYTMLVSDFKYVICPECGEKEYLT